MASDTITHDIAQVLPPELRPDVEHLVTEDDTPVDNIFSEKQQRLLTQSLFSSPEWSRGRSFVALANVGLYFAAHQPPHVPDVMLSLDVQLPEDPWPKGHRSYFVWGYGKPPEVVVEIVSNTEGGEDVEKFASYARIGVCYYVIYDPQQELSPQPLRAFQLTGKQYQLLSEPLWLPDAGLGLRIWEGRFEGYEKPWLRWTDAQGALLLTGDERAEQERQRAEQERNRVEQERQRAEQERQRAERLAEQLRRAGLEPEA